MGFYISYGDVALSDIRDVYCANRIGFGAKRIPRRAKKQLLKDWLRAKLGGK